MRRMTDCINCGKSTVMTKEQALKLECTGLHFLKDDLTPIMSHGVIVGTNPRVHKNAELGIGVWIGNNADIYQCRIGNHTRIKHFVEIQGDVIIGQFCKIESYVFIPEGTRIGNFVFIGPGTILTNDISPRATGDWKMAPVKIEDDVTVGAGAIILPGITLHQGCLVGAGAVVTKDVEVGITVVGNPARKLL